ncbi:Obp99a.2 family protein [Megaselia abdita]
MFTGEWLSCCNETFFSSWENVTIITKLCLNEFPDDINCFMLCFYSKFGKYDTINGFIVEAIKEQLGSQAYPDGSWTNEIANDIIKKCLDLVKLGPTTLDTLTCNPDIRLFGTCYWDLMFKNCPERLRNEKDCEF